MKIAQYNPAKDLAQNVEFKFQVTGNGFTFLGAQDADIAQVSLVLDKNDFFADIDAKVLKATQRLDAMDENGDELQSRTYREKVVFYTQIASHLKKTQSLSEVEEYDQAGGYTTEIEPFAKLTCQNREELQHRCVELAGEQGFNLKLRHITKLQSDRECLLVCSFSQPQVKKRNTA